MRLPIESLSTQCQRVLRYLGEYSTIDPIRALSELGIMRLAARISDLEKAGHVFEHQMVYTKDENGNPERYAKYKKVS